jgi:hypothetical protein
VDAAIDEWDTFTASKPIVSIVCVSQIDMRDYNVLISLSSVVLFAAFEHAIVFRLEMSMSNRNYWLSNTNLSAELPTHFALL